jgi:hypothetical protein
MHHIYYWFQDAREFVSSYWTNRFVLLLLLLLHPIGFDRLAIVAVAICSSDWIMEYLEGLALYLYARFPLSTGTVIAAAIRIASVITREFV